MDKDNFILNQSVGSLDVKKILQILYSKKLILLSSLFFTIVFGVLYSMTRSELYRSEALFMVEEDSPSIQSAEQMSQMMIGFESEITSSSVDNQITIIKSYDLIYRVVESMDLGLTVYRRGRFKSINSYLNHPFIVDLASDQFVPLGHFATLKKESKSKWRLTVKEGTYSFYRYKDGKMVNGQLKAKECEFEDQCKVSFPEGDITITLDSLKRKNVSEGTEYALGYKSYDSWTKQFKNNLTLSLVSKNTSVVRMQVKTEVPQLGVDFLNALMAHVRSEELDFRNRKADRIIGFIDQQLKKISDTLQTSEFSISAFQKQHAVVSLDKQSKVLFEKVRENETKQMQEQLCLRYGKYLQGYLGDHMDGNVLSPSIMGVGDPIILSEVNKLNKLQSDLVVEKQKSIVNKSEIERINTLKRSVTLTLSRRIAEWIEQHKQTVRILNGERNVLLSKLKEIPRLERYNQSLQRHYKVQEEIYNYLLMQRTTSQVARSSNKAKGSVVECSRISSSLKIAPKRSLILLVFAFLGLLVPVVCIVLCYFFADKIEDHKVLQQEIGLRHIFDIGHSHCGPKPIIFDPLSVVSEQFYQIRTIWESEETTAKDKCKVFVVTSSSAGEGKTFVSVNLALSYAKKGKKVLLVGADLRKPRLQNLLDYRSDIGLVDYLDGSVSLEDFYPQRSEEAFDFILSGKRQGSQATDLLSSSRLRKMLQFYRNGYDAIILDTAPLGLVPDTLSLVGLCDKMIFVVRRGVTSLRVFNVVWQYLLGHDRNVKIDLVFNDVCGPTYYHPSPEKSDKLSYRGRIGRKLRSRV